MEMKLIILIEMIILPTSSFDGIISCKFEWFISLFNIRWGEEEEKMKYELKKVYTNKC
jgi:hypothetical protein